MYTVFLQRMQLQQDCGSRAAYCSTVPLSKRTPLGERLLVHLRAQQREHATASTARIRLYRISDIIIKLPN
jgi:hypothetical protein